MHLALITTSRSSGMNGRSRSCDKTPVALCYEQHKHTHDLHLCPKPGAACVDLFEALDASGGSLIYLLWRYATSNINTHTTCTYALSQEQRVDLFEALDASGGSFIYLLWRYATSNINTHTTCTYALSQEQRVDLFEALDASGGSVHIPPVALCYEQHKHTHDLHLCPKPGAACGSVRSSRCLRRLVHIPPVALCYEQHKPLTNLHIVAGLRAPMAPHYEGQEPSLGWPTGLHGMTPKALETEDVGCRDPLLRIPPRPAPENRDTPGRLTPPALSGERTQTDSTIKANPPRLSMQFH